MNTELIAATWRAVGALQQDFIQRFYAAFFARHPRYRALFPAGLAVSHVRKMTLTVALLADLADEPGAIAPHLRRLRAAHQPYRLAREDFDAFRDTFIHVLSRELGPEWSDAAGLAWREAFDEVLIPALCDAPLDNPRVILDIPNMYAPEPESATKP